LLVEGGGFGGEAEWKKKKSGIRTRTVCENRVSSGKKSRGTPGGKRVTVTRGTENEAGSGKERDAVVIPK